MMKRLRLLALSALLPVTLLAGAGGMPAHAEGVLVNAAGGNFHVPVTSMREARFRSVILQQYDFSCGSAALATLLTFHYGRPTSELDAFEAMFAAGDQAKIRQVGFSLLDMKQYLERRGLRADGFKLTLDDLAEIDIPAITLIDLSGYKHFVLIKGVRAGRVLIGDPARGLIAMPRRDFEAIWNGIGFVIRDDEALGKASFNRTKEWAVYPSAPISAALSDQALGSFTMHLRTFTQF